MNSFIRVFLWCLVFVIMWIAVTKLDEWGMKDDLKHKPVFQNTPYKTWS